MKKRPFFVKRIVGVWTEAEVGVLTAELIRRAEISEQRFCCGSSNRLGLSRTSSER
jgi:hypothetical protein